MSQVKERDPPLRLLPAARAVAACFAQQWREQMTPSGILIPFINSLGLALNLAWIIGASGNALATSYVLVGAALMQTWSWSVWRTGWSVADEHNQGTLELMMTTRIPLLLIMFGKALAILALMAVSGVAVFLIVWLSAKSFQPIPHPEPLAGSIILAMASVIATSFVFAPFTFLMGSRGGFFNAILPFGAVVSGFLFPTTMLPIGLRVFAYALPTSWTMDAIVRSIRGEPTMPWIVVDWATASVLILVYFAIAAWCFRMVEFRVRVLGNLARG